MRIAMIPNIPPVSPGDVICILSLEPPADLCVHPVSRALFPSLHIPNCTRHLLEFKRAFVKETCSCRTVTCNDP